MKRHSVFFIIPLLLMLSACISTSVTPLNGKKYPPISEDQVEIYLDERDIPAEYEKVAIIYARGDYAMTDEEQMFKAVRKKAAKLGANGVLIQQVDEPGTGQKVAHAFLGIGADRKGEIIAIYVLRPDTERPEASR